MAVTFLVVLPLTHVIVVFFGVAALAEALGEGVAVGEGVTTGSAAWLNFTFSVGDENVNPSAASVIQPFRSEITVVATCDVPSDERIETEAAIGAFVNP